MMPVISIYDANGRRMSLGKEVGRGGEGTVYEVIGNPGRLAKIYTKTVSAEKTEKLAAMARVANPELLKIAAWPITTLHDTPSTTLLAPL
jgi:DNA-binding helix-hairpin-helix protein with protein kinase domain